MNDPSTLSVSVPLLGPVICGVFNVTVPPSGSKSLAKTPITADTVRTPSSFTV